MLFGIMIGQIIPLGINMKSIEIKNTNDMDTLLQC